MDFSGLEPTDLDDVRAINVAYLEFLRSAAGETQRLKLPARLRPAVAALTQRQAERLAGVPFLLLTLNESDESYWGHAREELPACDLFAENQNLLDPIAKIVVSALGFQWQLARRNAYAARLVSGACLAWCEQLAACSLLRVLQCASDCQRLVAPRQAAHEAFWTRLLGAGLSSAEDVRRAAQLSALQSVLSPAHSQTEQHWRSAACHASVPILQVHSDRVARDDK